MQHSRISMQEWWPLSATVMYRLIHSVDNPVLIYYHFQHECSIFIVKNASKQARNIYFSYASQTVGRKTTKKTQA